MAAGNKRSTSLSPGATVWYARPCLQSIKHGLKSKTVPPGQALAAAFVLLVALLCSGCRSADPSLFPARAGEPVADAIVLNNHWHTALIFKPADLPQSLRGQLKGLAVRKYVAIGWGDEGFFRAEHITPGLIAQALFYSRGSVLLVIGFDTEPEATFAPDVDIYRVPTTPASLNRIADFAATAFRRQGGRIIDAGPGIDGGQFFAARGRYAFYHTCNNWTADALGRRRNAGQRRPMQTPRGESWRFRLRQLHRSTAEWP